MDKRQPNLIYALSFAAQLGFMVVAPLVGFIWLGVVLDGWLGTAPAFVLIGLAVGLTVTVYDTYRLLEPLLNKTNEETKKDDSH
ncbi:MAG: AtpZ/AtpI family protein [Patescibacteria group bacterium]|nr:AtpZ/AtpI family protein [Patescibacteria group bacterium]